LEQATRITGDRYNAADFIERVRQAGTFDCVVDMICYEPKDAESLVTAVKGRTPHAIFCSTVDVYARPASRYPVREDEPRKPINAYGRGKAESEDILMDAAGADLKVTIIRPAHTYGPGGRHRGNFVHAFGSSTTFLDRLIRGKPIIVPGDGSALRGSTHLEDVSNVFVEAIRVPPDPLRVSHVTSEEWITWNRYHQILAESLGAPAPVLVPHGSAGAHRSPARNTLSGKLPVQRDLRQHDCAARSGILLHDRTRLAGDAGLGEAHGRFRK
jgi:nucleoside-diphosphate-sugar epimerase